MSPVDLKPLIRDIDGVIAAVRAAEIGHIPEIERTRAIKILEGARKVVRAQCRADDAPLDFIYPHDDGRAGRKPARRKAAKKKSAKKKTAKKAARKKAAAKPARKASGKAARKKPAKKNSGSRAPKRKTAKSTRRTKR